VRAAFMWLRVLAPLVVLSIGGFAAFTLITSRPQAKKRVAQTVAPLVEVVTASRTAEPVSVEAYGTVMPAHIVTIVPEVSGRLEYVAPDLVAGGLVQAGQILAKVDPESYKLRLEQQKAQMAKGQLELRVELSRQKVAEREWAALESSVSNSPGEADRELALRNPQIRAARAGISGARSLVDLAQIDLDRTSLVAPFDAYVREELAEPGQFVGPGAKLATLVATEAFWVELSVPVEALPWIRIPGVNAQADEDGSKVRLEQRSGEAAPIVREGWVLRLVPEVEPTGRLARLLVHVRDPLGLQLPVMERGLPMMVGAWVRAEIAGRTLEDAVAVPRQALRDGGQVWTADSEGLLQIRSVTVGWREDDRVLVTGGLEDGERVVTSPLAAPVAGMAVRVGGESAAAADAPAPKGAAEAPAAVAP
jgi:RND family efflux transporter MFP subunit